MFSKAEKKIVSLFIFTLVLMVAGLIATAVFITIMITEVQNNGGVKKIAEEIWNGK